MFLVFKNVPIVDFYMYVICYGDTIQEVCKTISPSRYANSKDVSTHFPYMYIKWDHSSSLHETPNDGTNCSIVSL